MNRLFPWLLAAWGCATAADSLRTPWPVLCEPAMTSAFGDYRPGHFHSGLDMKTWGKTGFPVIAEASGHVTRLSVATKGYGRAIYVLHDNGEYRVYGHLSSFGSVVEARVLDAQYREKRYAIKLEFKPDEYRVKKGDTLALSGESGVGFPHLHYEHRDRSNRPLNPLIRGLRVTDRLPPVLTGLTVKPMGWGVRVNGREGAALLDPVKESDGRYRIDKPVRVTGAVALAIKGYDCANAADNRFGVYRQTVYLNDSLVFQSRRDTLDFDATQQIHLDYDLVLLRSGYGAYENLYREPGNRLPIYCGFPEWGGVLYPAGTDRSGLKNGLNTVKIVSADAPGNRTEMKLILDYQALPAVSDSTRPVKGKGDALAEPVLMLGLDRDAAVLSCRLGRTLKPPRLALSFDSMTTLAPPLLSIEQGLWTARFRLPPGGYASLSAAVIIDSITGGISAYRRVWPLICLDSAVAGTAVSADARATVAVPKAGLVHRAGLLVEPCPDSLFKGLHKSLRPQGNAYRAFPRALYYDKSITVGIKTEAAAKTGLFTLSDKGAWGFVSDDYDVKTRTAFGRLRENQPFALMADTTPPVLSARALVRDNDTVSGRYLLLNAQDSGAGIESDRLVVSTLDGEWLLNEYDFETGEIKIDLARIKPGPHVLNLEVRDNLRNAAVITRTFIRR